MTADSRHVIVGGGLAAAKLAEQLREHNYDGPLTIVAAEQHLPYELPPLSKDHLLNSRKLPEFTIHPEQWYSEHHVELLRGTTATALDPAAKIVKLSNGTTLNYDRLALATGSRPRRPAIPGADAEGVYVLRTIEQSDALLDMFGTAQRLVIIGAGWIGLEVAAAARTAGVEVTVLETAAVPLRAALGQRMGVVFADVHREHGVDLRCGVRVTELEVTDGRVTGVRLAADTSTEAEKPSETVVPADAVLLAVGAQPNIELAEAAGLEVGDGVLVDAGLTTSNPDIVAVGDIANVDHPVLRRRIRVEHWANAHDQPATAAQTMLGAKASHEKLPFFFTDQYDLGMEYRGYVAADEQPSVVVRGDLPDREFVAFWLDSGRRVLAGMNVNVWDAGDRIEELIRSQEPVDPERLSDPTVPL